MVLGRRELLVSTAMCAAFSLVGCSGSDAQTVHGSNAVTEELADVLPAMLDDAQAAAEGIAEEAAVSTEDAIRSQLDIVEDYRAEFSHGSKGAEYQRYIVLHDTEGAGTPESVVSYWDSTDNGVAAHFVIGKDGHIVQCVALDEIAHHAGYGDTGHNELYGTVDESRDDKVGTAPIGNWASDYGMNSYSVGIELVHIGGEGSYPTAQLEALDGVIALIDAHYGFESEIIDHKAWRTGNSDTSAEFAKYLEAYQTTRTYTGSEG